MIERKISRMQEKLITRERSRVFKNCKYIILDTLKLIFSVYKHYQKNNEI